MHIPCLLSHEIFDYGEIFSFIAKSTSIRYLLFVVVAFDLEIEKMDMKTTFLHGDLDQEIYMKQLEVFIKEGKENISCKLKESLYGLKQSPRMWYQKFDTYILGISFFHSNVNHYIHMKQVVKDFIIITLYGDDMLFIGNSNKIISVVKSLLS